MHAAEGAIDGQPTAVIGLQRPLLTVQQFVMHPPGPPPVNTGPRFVAAQAHR